MEEVLGMILLVITIIVSLSVVGFMIFYGVDLEIGKKFRKYQKEGLSKEDWKNGEKEEYKHWLGY